MSGPVKSTKSGSSNTRRRNLIVSLLVVVLVVSLCVFVFVVNNGDGVVHVKNEVELVSAIDAAKVGVSVVIVLDNDISLSSPVAIPDGKDVTLTSNSVSEFFKLIGTNQRDTLFVANGGLLRIDGIIVTHAVGASGSGVTTNFGGGLVLLAGEISGNNVQFGAGVFNRGAFQMIGGVISGNTAEVNGAGVYNDGGVFNLEGGIIMGNTAGDSGGGLCNNNGTFNWLGGEISGNIANNGENIYEQE